MKPNEKFMLNEAWWKAGKPGTLTDTGLSNALRAFDTADHQFQADKTPQKYVAVTKALEAVNTARLATIQKCRGNLLLKDVKAALLKDGVIAQRQAVLKAAMAAVIDTRIQQLETSLNIETQRANKGLTTVHEIAGLIEADEKAGKSLEEHHTDLRDIWANLTVLGPISPLANNVMADLSPVNAHFPTQVARLKAIKLASLENSKKLKRVQEMILDYRGALV